MVRRPTGLWYGFAFLLHNSLSPQTSPEIDTSRMWLPQDFDAFRFETPERDPSQFICGQELQKLGGRRAQAGPVNKADMVDRSIDGGRLRREKGPMMERTKGIQWFGRRPSSVGHLPDCCDQPYSPTIVDQKSTILWMHLDAVTVQEYFVHRSIHSKALTRPRSPLGYPGPQPGPAQPNVGLKTHVARGARPEFSKPLRKMESGSEGAETHFFYLFVSSNCYFISRNY